jgi:UDP-N-acetyl-D-galactosamine dehydrogenase
MKKIIIKPAVIGLGYVGLPIFLNLQSKINTIGYDIDTSRVKDLNLKRDFNREYKKNALNLKKKSVITSNKKLLMKCNFFIVTVPTPIHNNYIPDLSFLKKSCEILGKLIKKNNIIFFESTVFPGVTENFCGKILEKKSGLKLNKDFFLGYSPERINPGDKKHTVNKIVKIVSSNNSYALKVGKKIYSKITKKIVLSKNIKEAESAKVIENIQRDLNIGLMNEIYKVCYNSNINFSNVIRLASTKWNFLKFNPGLVGGHCLPVDPYYYSTFAKKFGIKTDIILSGRKINNSMYKFMYNKLINEVKKLKINFRKSKILILGLTYKKNVSDIRNSYAINIYKLFKNKFKNLHVCDPLLKNKKIKNIKVLYDFNIKNYDLIINLVNHNVFKSKILKIKKNKQSYIELF